MTLLNLGTYPPKQCGIATFSMDLRNSLMLQGNQVQVMAISDESYLYDYPAEVIFNIRQSQKQDYKKAAAFINSAPNIQLVIIQHEYGIFGGWDGEYILELAKLLHKPFLLVTHTVLPRPSKRQKQVLNQLCHQAAGIACMTKRSSQLLADLYEAPKELVQIIPHGVPEFKAHPQEYLKEKYGYSGCEIISTFGLIGPGKGLELGIRAMAEIAPRFPSARYLILGQTHPMLRQAEGEKYRQMLIDLARELGLSEKIIFVNKYLSDEELGEYLFLTDIYLSPYPNRDQAVSGTLAFALGCGRAIVSTSYAYAAEVLAGGRGLLAKEACANELAYLIGKIIADPELKNSLQTTAYQLGAAWSWPNIGLKYTQFVNQIINFKTFQEESMVNYAEL